MIDKQLIYKDAARRAVLKANPSIAYCINNIKPVDAVEVVHGKWEKHLAPYTDDYYSCTHCNGNFMTEAAPYWNYCPNCGAKMDLED